MPLPRVRPSAVLVPLLVALVLSSIAPPAPAAERGAGSVVSPGRALFNDPLGDHDRQYALVRYIDARIDAARRGSTVRLAAFSFAMPSTSRALQRAYRRGVFVKVVVDERSRSWGSVKRLGNVLGHDVRKRSFIRVCRASCRGTGGRQHAKFVTISRTRHAERLVMVGSMNFTSFAAAHQWQDLYVLHGEDRLFLQMRTVFRSMVRDRPQPPLRLPGAGAGLHLGTAPAAADADGLRERLGRVRCRGAEDGTGSHGRTLLGISMHAWNGARGVALARRVADLREQGCVVRVLAGVGFGRRVLTVLHRGHVPVRGTGTRSGRPATHQKLMYLSGRFGRDRSASYVWTGSHNWTSRSLHNDEVTLRVAGAAHVAAYRTELGRIWRASPS